MDPFPNWLQGIRLLIGILLAASLSTLLLLLAWTGFQILRFRTLQRQGASEARDRQFDKHGRRRPPRATGICDQCDGVFAEVNVFDGNRRICDGCFAKSGGTHVDPTAFRAWSANTTPRQPS